MELLRALAKQAREETLPWITELIEPWLPQPLDLPDTKPRRELAAANSKFKVVDGVELHYFEVGCATPGRPTLFFWHGFNGSVFNWRYLFQALEAQGTAYHAIAFDRPPFGLSERPVEVLPDSTNPYSSKGACELASGLLAALGVERAVHVGHSAGASLALQYALQHPSEVEALIFLAPAIAVESFMPRDGGALLRFLYTRFLLSNDTLGLRYVRRRVLRSYQRVREDKDVGRHDNGTVTDEDIYYYLVPASAENWDIGALQNFRTFEFSGSTDINAVRQPVLVIQGLQDRATTPTFVNKIVERFKARPHGETKYVQQDRCGHLPMEEHPDAVASYMSEFLKGLGYPSLRAAEQMALPQPHEVGPAIR